MTSFSHPFTYVLKATGIHFCLSLGAAVFAAALVFGLWYPFPYRELSGGRELFLLVIAVDVICGPLLTLVLFNPAKARTELWRDLGLVALIQLGALSYGLGTVWEARPLFLVQEIDRFKVIAIPNFRGASITELPNALQPHWWKGPLPVAIREPNDVQERKTVLFSPCKVAETTLNAPSFTCPMRAKPPSNP